MYVPGDALSGDKGVETKVGSVKQNMHVTKSP